MVFEGEGPLNDEEIKTLLDTYHKYGKNEYQTKLYLSDDVDSKTNELVNQLTQRMGNLSDRLVETIDRLYSANPKG